MCDAMAVLTGDLRRYGFIGNEINEAFQTGNWVDMFRSKIHMRLLVADDRWAAFAILEDVLRGDLPADEYLRLLRLIWVEGETGIAPLIRQKFFESKPYRNINPLDMMTPEESVLYEALPDEFYVYRGCTEEGVSGFSWTLNIDIARGFVQMETGIEMGTLGSDMMESDEGTETESQAAFLYRASCNNNNVLAYFNTEFHEQEIIVNSATLTNIEQLEEL